MRHLPLPRRPDDFQQPPSAVELQAFAARLLGPDVAAGVVEATELGGDGARIVALLDHERGLFGDPLNEWVFNFDGQAFPPMFWEAYGAGPVDPASQVRAAIYRGMIDIQCLREETRHECDASAHRRSLAREADALRRLLAPV